MKHKYIIEVNDEGDGGLDDLSKLQDIMKIDDYNHFISFLFDDVLRYKHKEDMLIAQYGDRALDLIDRLKKELLEKLEDLSLKF